MKKHMKRKGMAAAAALLSICMAFPGLAGQWNQDENGKWYERDDGTYIQNDWLQDTDGKWDYFDENGYAETGLVEGMFANYMMGPDGAMYTNCTVYINGKFYDADEYGILSPNKGGEGWIAGANGWWYRTDGDEFLKNQWMDEDGSRYYFGEDGYMVTGWLGVDGKRGGYRESAAADPAAVGYSAQGGSGRGAGVWQSGGAAALSYTHGRSQKPRGYTI